MRDAQPATSSRQASKRDLGLLAFVGLAVCCGLPLLISAGALAALGGFLGSPWVIAAGLALAIPAVAYARARRRAGDCACDLPEATAAGAERHERYR